MKQTLLIHLDAPLQSWGIDSLYERRSAGTAPSKSAVCGMICAAFGAAKGSDKEQSIIAGINAAVMTTFCLRSGNVMTDYHTVQRFARAEGKIDQKGTVQTYRQYWSYAQFIVLLESEDGHFLEQARQALLNPHWGVWFGRKCCIPAAPLIQEPLCEPSAARELALKGYQPDMVEIYAEAENFDEGDDTWMDAPVSFGRANSAGRTGREHKPRRVKHIFPLAEPEPFFELDAPV